MKPVSRTAFYCTGVRALDARAPRPVCGDRFAERFMDEAAWRIFEPFRNFTAPNASNITRHRIIDDLLRDRLAAQPGLRIVLIGAGFDSRAYRLKGGRWL
jgi:O-methyltransferase involved in polyketide biosynthesis